MAHDATPLLDGQVQTYGGQERLLNQFVAHQSSSSAAPLLPTRGSGGLRYWR